MRLIVLLLLLVGKLQAQVNFVFIPEINSRSVDALMNIKVMNAGGTDLGDLQIDVKQKGIPVVRIINKNFRLVSGINTALRNGQMSISFYDNQVARIVRQTGRFSEGEYEVCYSFNSYHSISTNECYSFDASVLFPLQLAEPFQNQNICELRPNFQWNPVFPAVNNATYSLVLVEVKPGQAPQEAFAYNLPVIHQKYINTNMLIFPTSVKSLEEGKKYAWRVSLMTAETVVIRSDIWTFTCGCKEEEERFNFVFKDIEDLSKGDFYVSNGFVNFYLKNYYSDTDLNYTISPINADKPLKNLPKVKINKGDNKVSIDLRNVKNMKFDSQYILTIHMVNGDKKTLRFVYKYEK